MEDPSKVDPSIQAPDKGPGSLEDPEGLETSTSLIWERSMLFIRWFRPMHPHCRQKHCGTCVRRTIRYALVSL